MGIPTGCACLLRLLSIEKMMMDFTSLIIYSIGGRGKIFSLLREQN
jgi:hypothetical protein